MYIPSSVVMSCEKCQKERDPGYKDLKYVSFRERQDSALEMGVECRHRLASLHQQELSEMIQASDKDVSQVFPDTSHRKRLGEDPELYYPSRLAKKHLEIPQSELEDVTGRRGV